MRVSGQEHDKMIDLLRFLDLSVTNKLLYDIPSNSVTASNAYNRKIVVEATSSFRVFCVTLRTRYVIDL